MAHPLTDKITQQLAQQQATGLLRQRKLLGFGTDTNVINVDFSHNDYLGLASSVELAQALYQGALTYGVGSKASPLVSGYGAAHQLLEQKLCDITGHQACMLFCSGFSANSALMKTLFTSTDVVIADKLVHASIIDGIVDSGAKLVRYLHNDIDSAAHLLAKHPNNVLITESVFSMDGDLAPVDALARSCEKHQAWLMVDDAHGLGVLGQTGGGIAEHFQLSQDQLPVLMGTLGKSFGTFGAFIAGSDALIETLIQLARTYIYTTALPPAVAAATRTSLQLLQSEHWRREKLQLLIQRFRTGVEQIGLPLMPSPTPIQPIVLGTAERAMRWSSQLAKQGILVTAIRPPTVPLGSARLRVTLSAMHTESQVDQLLDALTLLAQTDHSVE